MKDKKKQVINEKKEKLKKGSTSKVADAGEGNDPDKEEK